MFGGRVQKNAIKLLMSGVNCFTSRYVVSLHDAKGPPCNSCSSVCDALITASSLARDPSDLAQSLSRKGPICQIHRKLGSKVSAADSAETQAKFSRQD